MGFINMSEFSFLSYFSLLNKEEYDNFLYKLFKINLKIKYI